MPFLGAGACTGHLPSGGDLSRDWAARHGYPLDDPADLARVMQYVATTRIRDATTLKEDLAAELFHDVRPPDFTADDQIHSVLAAFGLPVYVTTNYDDFMALALRHHRKDPREALSPWYSTVAPNRRHPVNAADHEPTPEHPLVFHLHGHHTTPASMVLTEDDYIEYLVRLAADTHRSPSTSLLPPDVRDALRNRPLLFVGYSLHDWTFRVLFRTLLHGIPIEQRRRHVSVQLDPAAHAGGPAAAAARGYLDEYFETQRISIFWGTAREFAAELARRAATGGTA